MNALGWWIMGLSLAALVALLGMAYTSAIQERVALQLPQRADGTTADRIYSHYVDGLSQAICVALATLLMGVALALGNQIDGRLLCLLLGYALIRMADVTTMHLRLHSQIRKANHATNTAEPDHSAV